MENGTAQTNFEIERDTDPHIHDYAQSAHSPHVVKMGEDLHKCWPLSGLRSPAPHDKLADVGWGAFW